MATLELMERSLRSAATALGNDSRASGFVKQRLALKIGGLDKIAVDDAQAANSGAMSRLAVAAPMAPQPTRPRWRPAGAPDLLTKRLKKDLSRIFFSQRILHELSGPGGRRLMARNNDDSAKGERMGNAAVLRFV